MSCKIQFDEIRQILLRDWDPVGVGDNPNLADEYDGYLGGIMRLMENGCSFSELQQHLAHIEEELGIQLPNEQRSKAARALLGQ